MRELAAAGLGTILLMQFSLVGVAGRSGLHQPLLRIFVPRLLPQSTAAISVAALKNAATKNGLVNGLVQMVGRSIENKVDNFMIIAGFSSLAQISELLVPAENIT